MAFRLNVRGFLSSQCKQLGFIQWKMDFIVQGNKKFNLQPTAQLIVIFVPTFRTFNCKFKSMRGEEYSDSWDWMWNIPQLMGFCPSLLSLMPTLWDSSLVGACERRLFCPALVGIAWEHHTGFLWRCWGLSSSRDSPWHSSPWRAPSSSLGCLDHVLTTPQKAPGEHLLQQRIKNSCSCEWLKIPEGFCCPAVDSMPQKSGEWDQFATSEGRRAAQCYKQLWVLKLFF